MPKIRNVLPAALVMILAGRTSRADSTICAVGRLVETGETTAYVLGHCGGPSQRQAYDLHGRLGYTVTHVEEWVYVLGPGSFPRLLHFENGLLRWITVLSR